MTRQQFLEEIKQLSVAERIALIETITRTLREDLNIEGNGGSFTAAANAGQNGEPERERKIAAIRRLRGIAKFDGEPPSDEELKEDYINYLTEKYS
ncbi:MAG TPA: hypothetical protein VF656_19530 [Pyrinomonadaceae bacterium]|jgi:hypothetical protein